MVSFLLKTQRADGHWATGGRRPPLEESVVTGTALAAIEDCAGSPPPTSATRSRPPSRRPKAGSRRPRVRSRKTATARLWGLQALGADADEIAEAREAVLAAQHEDGGWPSRRRPAERRLRHRPDPRPAPLRRACRRPIRPTDAGCDYLLETQQDDGSWKVETRSKPVQVYFDNGDPHGKHQFISIPATSWAVVALAAALAPSGRAAAEPYDLAHPGRPDRRRDGQPLVPGDLAIRGDRIAAVGRIDPDGPARRTIERAGWSSRPGFIDMHSHSDIPCSKTAPRRARSARG